MSSVDPNLSNEKARGSLLQMLQTRCWATFCSMLRAFFSATETIQVLYWSLLASFWVGCPQPCFQQHKVLFGSLSWSAMGRTFVEVVHWESQRAHVMVWHTMTSYDLQTTAVHNNSISLWVCVCFIKGGFVLWFVQSRCAMLCWCMLWCMFA